jgi:hypothetical protein
MVFLRRLIELFGETRSQIIIKRSEADQWSVELTECPALHYVLFALPTLSGAISLRRDCGHSFLTADGSSRI